MTTRGIDDRVRAVVQAGNCSGCGACCLLDTGLQMQLDEHGYARPVRVAPGTDRLADVRFERICPGVTLQAPRSGGSGRRGILGRSINSWQAWAVDAEIRFRGSSGGTITALTQWMLATGRVSEVVAATRDAQEPLRTVTVTLRTPSRVIEAAGSRYAPVSNAARGLVGRQDVAFVGKPCEVSAIRAVARETGEPAPVLISFFCAGTPSQSATVGLVDRLAGGRRPTDLWYRGNGCPGHFTVTFEDGTVAAETYDRSWGQALGPTIQWRCKICADGVGEAADIVAADYWDSDADGYPVFDEGDGVSALIARTPRGAALLKQAFEAGVIDGRPLDLDALARVQPSQVRRRRTLFARLLGARLAGRRVPRFRGYGLLAATRGAPRQLLRVAVGSYARSRAGRTDG